MKQFLSGVIFLTLLFHYTASFAIPTPVIKPTQDSNTVKKLLDSAYVLESTDKDAALTIYRKAYTIGVQINYILGQAKALHYSGIVYSDKSQYPKAIDMYRKALKLYHKINYPRGIGACYTNIGNIYQYESKLDSAVANYQQGLKVFEEFSLTNALAQASGNVGNIFQQAGQFEKAYHYHNQSIKYAEITKDSSILANSLINLGSILDALDKQEQSFETHKRALKIGTLTNNYYVIQLASINIADYYKDKQQYTEAIKYGLRSLHYANKLSSTFDIADIKNRLGDLYLLDKNYTTAEIYFNEAMALSEPLKTTGLTSSIYNSLNKLYAATGDYKEAYKYLSLAKNLNDSILGEKQIKSISELEVKYQTAQKDQQLVQKQLQIAKQDLRIKQKTRILMITIAGIILLLIASAFIFINYRNKMKLQTQHLILLEKKKEINILEAMIKGEEKERSRIAKDLHDGVGGLLSAAKMQFSVLSTEIFQLTGKDQFSKALNLLDDSAGEIRKIAHNLMPELLINYGLGEALSHFVNRMNNTHLKISFISIGELPEVNQNYELTIYRIVQELINNIIKHADASEALVQLSFQEDVLSITVEDNGKGFDLTTATNGAGLSSIQTRVAALGGSFELTGSINNGTTVFIEFDLAVNNYV
ncbi:tetratricopeptide repeat-containing sensor histidine kinase [Solitalea canadensis]|nr:sensor histidine kinase [Solitalea canadensis]